MNDESFELENLLNDDSFIKWVLFNEDAFIWEEFMYTNPDKKEMIDRASQFVREMNKAENVTQDTIDEGRVLSRIRATLGSETQEMPMPGMSVWKAYPVKWAAALVMGLIFLFVFRTYYPVKETITYTELIVHAEKTSELSEQVNLSDNPLKIMLEDGTVVTLEKNSKLSYPLHFENQRREVFLSGEAFFDVKRNSSKPFYVYANETVTKVLGTSFVIKAFDGEQNVTVHVRTGRVSVYRQSRIQTTDPEISGLILLPNQQVTFDRENESLIKNLVKMPVPIIPIPAESRRTFEEVPVSEVFRELEKIYGVRILFDQDGLSKCIISTSIHNAPLYDNLDVICKTIGGAYKEVDAQIVVESKGCP